MKKVNLFVVALMISLGASSASAASLSSVTCSSDLVTFNFSGVTEATSVTMEASQSGSNWSIIGAGELDGSNASPSIGVPTNLSEFIEIISNNSTASYRAVIGGTITTVSCS